MLGFFSRFLQALKGQRVFGDVDARLLPEFIGDKAESTSRFTGGGASFKTTGFAPEQSSFNLGAGVTVYPGNAFSIKLKYDYEGRSGYSGHAGTATAKWEF